jgi:hypothetical protein
MAHLSVHELPHFPPFDAQTPMFPRLFQNLNRLRVVRDICPLPGFPSHDAHIWKGVALKSKTPVIEHPNGYTVTDFHNQFLTWHRTFTQNHDVPILSAQSLIHIHEWIPPTEASQQKLHTTSRNFFRFSMHHFEAVAVLKDDFEKTWSEHARRHLKSAQKNPHLKCRLGTLDEIRAILPTSQVPLSLHETFCALVERHLNDHPNDIDVMIATLDDHPVAGFVAGHCDSAHESSYLVGCFTGDGGKVHAMTLLVHWWFQRCMKRGLLHANFGDIVGPRPFPFDDMIGYSNFKTHFNIHRVWMPGSRWRITFPILSRCSFRDR